MTDRLAEIAQRTVRATIATLHNATCAACRQLTSVGESCEVHAPDFDALDVLLSEVSRLQQENQEMQAEVTRLHDALTSYAKAAVLLREELSALRSAPQPCAHRDVYGVDRGSAIGFVFRCRDCGKVDWDLEAFKVTP